MKKVYIASPYAGLRCDDNIRAYLALKVAKEAYIKAKKAGFVPISPVIELDGKVDEATQRDIAINAGLDMLKDCDYIYFSTHPDAKFSKGMQIERQMAKELFIPEITISANGSVDVLLGI